MTGGVINKDMGLGPKVQVKAKDRGCKVKDKYDPKNRRYTLKFKSAQDKPIL